MFVFEKVYYSVNSAMEVALCKQQIRSCQLHLNLALALISFLKIT